MEDTSQLLTQDSASNSTSINLYSGLSKNVNNNININDESVIKLATGYNKRWSAARRACNVCLHLTDLVANAVLITPLAICYWAATWDIISLYIFPTDYIVSYLFTFLLSNIVLMSAYLFQNELQLVHNRLRTSKPQVYDAVQVEATTTVAASSSSSSSSTNSLATATTNNGRYYDAAFLFRCLYSYLVANAYVAQWRTYWDILDYLTVGVHYMYFLVIALIALFLYRVVLNNSLEAYTKTVPFSLVRDNNLDSYFIQWKKIHTNNVRFFFNF
jgi:hypothetical protein